MVLNKSASVLKLKHILPKNLQYLLLFYIKKYNVLSQNLQFIRHIANEIPNVIKKTQYLMIKTKIK